MFKFKYLYANLLIVQFDITNIKLCVVYTSIVNSIIKCIYIYIT